MATATGQPREGRRTEGRDKGRGQTRPSIVRCQEKEPLLPLSLSLILSSCRRALPRSPPSFFPPTTTISSSLVQSYVTSHRGHTRPGSDITQLPTSMSISPHRDAAAARPRLARARAAHTTYRLRRAYLPSKHVRPPKFCPHWPRSRLWRDVAV